MTGTAAVEGHRLRAALAGAITTVLALVASWHPSLWTDEAATISASGRSLPELWRMLGELDLVHGFYYLIMHFWTSAFGIGEFALRLPSALFIGVAGACVSLIGLRLGGAALAITASVVFALMPRITWAGMEARPYALTAMFAAGATLALLGALESNRRSTWVGYSVLVFLGVLANLFTGLLLAAHLVGVLWVARNRLRPWLVAAGAAALVSVPLVLAAAGQARQLGERRFSPFDLAQYLIANQWFLGDTPTTTTGVSTTAIQASDPATWWMPASLVVAALAWMLMLTAVIRGWSGSRPLIAWTVPWIVIPPLVVGLYSLVGTPMYSPRYFTFAAPAVAVLVAAGFLAIPRRSFQTVVAGALVLAVIPVYLSQRTLYAKSSSDWVSLAGFVQATGQPGDGVYFVPRYDVPGDVVGQTSRYTRVAYPAAFDGMIDITQAQTPAETGNLAGASRRLAASTTELGRVDRVWVVQRRDYPAASAQQDSQLLTAAGFQLADEWSGPLTRVLRYDRTT